MTGNVHNRLMARFPRFSEPRDERVPVIVPATLYVSGLSDFPPYRYKAGARFRWIAGLGFASREDEPFRLQLFEPP